MVSVTDSTRNAVWQEMLDTARLVRYYDAMSSRQQRWNRGVRLVLLASATAGIAAGMNALPESFRVVSGAVIGVLVAWGLPRRPREQSGQCWDPSGASATKRRWSWLHSGGRSADSVDDEEARRVLSELAPTRDALDRPRRSAHIPTNERLNVRCEEAAFKALADRYAAG